MKQKAKNKDKTMSRAGRILLIILGIWLVLAITWGVLELGAKRGRAFFENEQKALFERVFNRCGLGEVPLRVSNKDALCLGRSLIKEINGIKE